MSLSFFLQFFVCFLLFRGGHYRRLSFFAAYVVLNLLVGAAFLWVFRAFGFATTAAFLIAWGLQALVLAARGVVVRELCRNALREYRGVWFLAWRLLVGWALCWAAFAGLRAYDVGLTGERAIQRIPDFIALLEQGLEWTSAVVLLALVGICRHYRVPLERSDRFVILGLGCYSLIQVVSNGLLGYPRGDALTLWNIVRIVSFQATLLFWIWGLRFPARAPVPAPAIFTSGQYEHLATEVNQGLRNLNARLLETFKS